MRLILALIAVVLALPAGAQQISPMTGTTAGPGPGAAAPGAPAPSPMVVPPASTGDAARPARRPHRSFRERFEAANTSHDGNLTLEQARAGRLTRIVTHFDAIDTGRRGYVTMADIRAYNRAQRQARRQQH